MRITGILLFLFLSLNSRSQYKNDLLLEEILRKDTTSILKKLIHNPDSFRIQIIYTMIDRDGQNVPHFRNYYFNVHPDLYYYPASTVKLPLAALSLEKLDRLGKKDLDKDTRMVFDSSFSGQKTLITDSSSRNGYPSLGQFIRKAFLISDNDAYNRMYEFIGQQELNNRLHSLGYSNTKIVRQFMPMNELENRHTNAIRFLDSNGRIVYEQAAQFNVDSFKFSVPALVGHAYLDARDSLIHQPKDFTRHNHISVDDLQQMLQRILFPLSVSDEKRFVLNKDDYSFLKKFLSQYPSETSYPKYDTSEFYDSYVKFYFQKGGRFIPENIRVFNKVGWAYGFLTDVSYVADFKNNIEYMITATVYANEDGVLNDNTYEYETVALPFLYRVGQDIYEYDLNRKRHFKPDLSEFKLSYDKRDAHDTRTSIKEVDN